MGKEKWIITFPQIADGGDLEPQMFGLTTKFNKMQKDTINHENPAIGNVLLAVRSIQFERKYAMKNGNKLTKKNWHKVVALSTRPCTNVRGVAVIDNEIAVNGQYFEKWALRYEPKDEFSPAGYIFREVNHNGGISGRHSTPKEAVWSAMKHYIQVWLEE